MPPSRCAAATYRDHGFLRTGRVCARGEIPSIFFAPREAAWPMTSLTAMQYHTRFWGNSRHGGWRPQLRVGPTLLFCGSGWSPPHALREPSRARVDAALPADELVQRLGIRL